MKLNKRFRADLNLLASPTLERIQRWLMIVYWRGFCAYSVRRVSAAS